MNLSRLVVLTVAGVGLLCPLSLRADAPPYTPDKQFSTDQVITTKEGMSISSKMYMNDGKVRTEMTTSGMQVIQIMRPDQSKIYSVMPAQKMTMVMNLDPKMTAQIKAASGDEGKFEVAGAEAVDGTPCNKYKMTTKDGKIFWWWIDAAKKSPVKMAAEDGSFTLVWKNYKAGPQDAALFEPPKDYQTMEMPGGAGAGAGAGGQ